MGAVNIAALITNLGAYCREDRDTIYDNMLLSLEKNIARSGIQVYENVKDEEPLINAKSTSIIQTGNANVFNPTNDFLTFGNRMLKVKKIKVDLQITPQDYEQSWLQHRYKDARVNNTLEGLPFYKYLLDKIIEAVNSDLRRVMWLGDTASGNAQLQVMDGFIKKFKADVTATNIPVVDVTTFLGGGFTKNNLWDGLNYFKDGISDVQFEEELGGKIHIPVTLYKWLLALTEAQIGRTLMFDTIPGDRGGKKIFFAGTNIEIVPQTNFSFNTSTGFAQLAFTENDNLIFGTGVFDETMNMEFEKNHRQIDIMMDFKAAAEYALASTTGRNVFVNTGF